MGLFDRFSKPKTTRYRVTSMVASFIEYVINDAGIDVLGARSIVLRHDFGISLGVKTQSRGGDILAVVQPNELGLFVDLRESFSEIDEKTRRQFMALGVFKESIDRIAYAVADEFSKQSPEFKRLA